MAILVWTGVETTLVDNAKIKSVVTEFVQAKLGKMNRAIIEFHGRMPNIATRSANYSIRVAADVLPEMKGYVSIPVEIVSGKRVEGRAVISVYCRTFDTVAVTIRQIQRHEQIKQEDIAFKEIETTMLESDVVTSVLDLAGKRSTRIITANSILRQGMMERIPVLKQDDRVTIAVRSNYSTVTANGIVEEDGGIGDFITVQRVGSHQRVHAQVIDARTVEIRIDEFNRRQPSR